MSIEAIIFVMKQDGVLIDDEDDGLDDNDGEARSSSK